MFNLDTPPGEIIDHPDFAAPDYCRSTIRVRRFNDGSMRELLSRPIQSSILEACFNLKEQVWHLCDVELQEAVLSYLEKNNG